MSAIVTSLENRARDGGAQAFADRERARGEACPVHRLRKDRERVLSRRFHNHVVCLRRRNPELIDGDGMHVLTVGCDNRQLQTGNAHVEVRHR